MRFFKIFVALVLCFILVIPLPAIAATTRKLTANNCGYVTISETLKYKHANILSVNGAGFSAFAVVPYTSQNNPSCRKGSDGKYLYPGWDGKHFKSAGKIFASTRAFPKSSVTIAYK